MSAAFGIGPNDILAAPPEITDQLEEIRNRLAQHKATATPGGSPAPLPALTDDEILRSIEAAEFGLPS